MLELKVISNGLMQ